MGRLTEVQLKAIGGHDERRKHEPRDNQAPVTASWRNQGDRSAGPRAEVVGGSSYQTGKPTGKRNYYVLCPPPQGLARPPNRAASMRLCDN
jgi:hypothetical protein